MAQAAKVALLAEFDGEDLTGYFLIGDSVAARIKVGEPESGKCFPFSRGSGSAIAAFLAPTQARISLKTKEN